MDVLSFRLKWRPGDPQELFAVIRKGLLMAMIYRGDYWQVALLMPKGFNPQDVFRRSARNGLASPTASVLNGPIVLSDSALL